MLQPYTKKNGRHYDGRGDYGVDRGRREVRLTLFNETITAVISIIFLVLLIAGCVPKHRLKQ